MQEMKNMLDRLLTGLEANTLNPIAQVGEPTIIVAHNFCSLDLNLTLFSLDSIAPADRAFSRTIFRALFLYYMRKLQTMHLVTHG